MTETSIQPQSLDLDEALRQRIFERAKAINAKLLARFSTAAEDLEVGQHRAALGGLGGVESQIHTLRSFLLLLQ
jgi:hypothetical protein